MNKSEPRPPAPAAGQLRPPTGMTGDAKKQWLTITRQLTDARILTELDLTALALHCEAYATWRQACRELKKLGAAVMTETESGFRQPSPWFGIRNAAFKQVLSTLSEFGMTPSSRSRVSTTGGGEESAFAKFLANKRA